MRADPTDRIIHFDAPEVSPVSVPRIFAVGLALPFLHPLRFLIGGILPTALMVAVGFGPMERIVALFNAPDPVVFEPNGSAAVTTGTTTPAPLTIVNDMLTLQGVLILAMALWFCTWQRAAARNFAEPIPRWLGASLLRLPGFILAFIVWMLAPALVMLVPFAVMLALIALNAGAGWAIPVAQVADEMMAIPEMLSDLQWWVLAVALLVVALIALWLSARLCPLPALVASRGWRHALGRAWGLSRGHGFGLSVALFGYSMLGFIVLTIASAVLAAVMAARAGGGMPDTVSLITYGSIADLVVAALIAIWQASLGALVVRDGLSPAEALDPAMFD